MEKEFGIVLAAVILLSVLAIVPIMSEEIETNSIPEEVKDTDGNTGNTTKTVIVREKPGDIDSSGEWKGTTSRGGNVSLSASENVVSFFRITYPALSHNGTDTYVAFYGMEIVDNEFSNSAQTITGVFLSNDTAMGTFDTSLVPGGLGEIITWNATKEPMQLMSIFDTGEPANTYPSIFGTHKGTIKPNQTITVSKLYTYPYAGTGGYTGYAKIYNNSWSIETLSWEGYTRDWHNVTFTEQFTLEEDKTYNYTIRTGSYPQIHHTPALPTENGWINCSSFVDANGKIYDDWIPAIRLE